MPNTICQITGTIKDSGGSPVSGKLIITLDANLSDDTTNPDSLLTTVPKEYIIPATGVITGVSLLESATQKVTYFFQFFRLVSVGVYDTKALLDFHEIVPDFATAEFDQLAKETGITTTNLSTGALKVAREILTNPVLSSLIFNSSQVFKSNIKPLLPLDGAIWFQPSRGIYWRYDLARLKWKSQVFTVQSGARNINVSSLIFNRVPWVEFPSIIVERMDLRFYVLAAPNDISNRWLIQPSRQTQGSDTAIGFVTAVITNGNAVSTNIKTAFTPNVTLAPTDLDTVGLTFEKQGLPGNLTASCTYSFSFLEN